MGTKTLFISDVKSFRHLEDYMGALRKNNIEFDQVVVAGNLLNDYQWQTYAVHLDKGLELLEKSLREIKKHTISVIYLPGETDLKPEYSEDMCRALDVVQMAERLSDEHDLYGSSVLEGRGYSMISWGPGAGIGGQAGYLKEINMVGEGGLPQSSVIASDSDGTRLNPLYSGMVFRETFEDRLREAKSGNRIIVSHMPIYAGNDLVEVSGDATPFVLSTDEFLDEAMISDEESGFEQPVHVGDIFFRHFVNGLVDDWRGATYKILFGHVEDRKGKGKIGNICVENIGEFLPENAVVHEL